MLSDIQTSRLTLRLMHGPVISACLAGDRATASKLFGTLIPEEFLDHPSSLRFNRIFTAYRRRGFAFEAAKALIEWARTGFDVHHFIASISPHNLPSTQLIGQLGFEKIAEAIDEIDGVEYIYMAIK